METADRCRSLEFAVTQAALARALGVRRQRVNVIATQMMKARIIEYVNGELTILHRRHLADECCSCYRAFQETYTSMMHEFSPH